MVFLLISTPALAQIRPAPFAELNTWYEQARAACADDPEYMRITKQYYDDAFSCIGGDSIACDKREKNLGEIKRWNAEFRAVQTGGQGESVEQKGIGDK